MAENLLGKLCTANHRDAMHVAVIPAVLAVPMMPGQYVQIEDGVAHPVLPSMPSIGVVDPFLRGMQGANVRVWILIHPNQVSNLRHEWNHPDLDPSDPIDPYDDDCRFC